MASQVQKWKDEVRKVNYAAILLCAGYGTRLERDLRNAGDETLRELIGCPKPLLPLDGGVLIDKWVRALFQHPQIGVHGVHLVCNQAHAAYYQSWAARRGLPEHALCVDGTISNEDRLGAIADLQLVIRKHYIREPCIVIAGDTLFRSSCEDIIDRLIRGVQRVKQSGLSCDALLTYYETSTSDVSRRGIVEVEKVDLAVKSGWNEISSVTRFLEKPAPSETGSRLAVPALYLFDTTCFSLLNSFLELHRALPLCERDAPGKFVKWLCSSLIGASGSRKVAVRCLSVPGRFDVGNLADYLTTRAHFAQDRRVSVLQWGKGKVDAICAQTWARVGLMGNPSDGFHGRTLAMTVKNFYAEVRLNPGGEGSRQIVFLPHPRHDRVDFSSREVLESHVYRETYGGGMRLLKAACITFFEFCQGRKLVLKEEGFSLQYRTNIPRQVGLGGSSAIITSTLRCLFRHFALSIGPADLSSLALRVEMKELGIQAGLQDRVVQAYEGLVYMDFDKQHMEQHGHGIYKVLPEGVVKRLPVFLLVWLGKPSNSGRIHSNVRKRYDQGCKMVMDAMSTFGSYAEKAEQILMDEEIAKDKVQDEFLELMNKNFDLRVQLYGRLCVGDDNIKMVEMLRKYGVAAKFPGSGGAVLGALPPAFERLEELRGELADCGYKSCILEYVSE